MFGYPRTPPGTQNCPPPLLALWNSERSRWVKICCQLWYQLPNCFLRKERHGATIRIQNPINNATWSARMQSWYHTTLRLCETSPPNSYKARGQQYCGIPINRFVYNCYQGPCTSRSVRMRVVSGFWDHGKESQRDSNSKHVRFLQPVSGAFLRGRRWSPTSNCLF